MLEKWAFHPKNARRIVSKGYTLGPDQLVPPDDDDGGDGGDGVTATSPISVYSIAPARTDLVFPAGSSGNRALHYNYAALIYSSDASWDTNTEDYWTAPKTGFYRLDSTVFISSDFPLEKQTLRFEMRIWGNAQAYINNNSILATHTLDRIEWDATTTSSQWVYAQGSRLLLLGEGNVIVHYVSFAAQTTTASEARILVSDTHNNRFSIQWAGPITPYTGGEPTPPPGDSLLFGTSAPGRLTLEGGQYYADYTVADTHFGYTKAEVQDLLSSILPDPEGWEQAGIIFREVGDGPVLFQVLEEATCSSPELACTHYAGNDPDAETAFVELEYDPLNGSAGPGVGAPNIINHEAGHAFFSAQHSGGGIMSDFDNDRPAWPTDNDIAATQAWLGN
jgi:hypothetical protein